MKKGISMKKIKIKYEFKNKDILNSQIIEAKIDNDCISFYDKTNNYNSFDYKRKIILVRSDSCLFKSHIFSSG